LDWVTLRACSRIDFVQSHLRGIQNKCIGGKGEEG
jgi:hypothetical protein